MKKWHNSEVENTIYISTKELLFEKGSKGWNMNDCASKAGVTKRTLYHYIDSKSQLIEWVMTSYIQETLELLRKELESISDLKEQLKCFVGIYPKLIGRMETTVIKQLLLDYPEIESMVIETRQSLSSEMVNLIESYQESGVIDSSIAPLTIVETIQAVVLYHIKNNDEHFERSVEQGLALIMSGILKE